MIESLIAAFLSSQGNKMHLSIPKNFIWSPDSGIIQTDSDSVQKVRLKPSARNTACLFRILEICYKNIKVNTYSTKR